jgi:hypothetical protein
VDVKLSIDVLEYQLEMMLGIAYLCLIVSSRSFMKCYARFRYTFRCIASSVVKIDSSIISFSLCNHLRLYDTVQMTYYHILRPPHCPDITVYSSWEA